MGGGGQDEGVGQADGPVLGSVHVPGQIEDVIVDRLENVCYNQ